MHLNKEKTKELFAEFSNNGTMNFEQFRACIQLITDKSNMLESPNYISLPDLRNKLGVPAHVSSIISLHKEERIDDQRLIEILHESADSFAKSIKILSRHD